ncbi:YdcF family protein [Prosthecomicrobium pneumaticum]|uniref:Uncharacterized SAM-binding protein YcdF (DUF218 family) n=1 Tax=Prosthecomicrobium pneumaticum TaxID=81895 RepID=A0A7W9FQI6_9HYPH|nr:YdcF family protein [Prosthecomicrobium pneumaticum]MBB5754965.1 uncharacterized SAM-binding protein YcdF (DUF218 family) [Prosthecomicrobium pneumaticum]
MSDAARSFSMAGEDHALRRRRGRRLVRSIRRALVATLVPVLLGAVALDFDRFADRAVRAGGATAEHADAIVALTGGPARIERALDLLAANRAGRLFISGVHPGVGTPELADQVPPARRRYLECCAELGYAAQNTIGNADETRDWAIRNGVRSLIVVTSAFHMPRSLAEFARAMPDVRLIPYPVSNGSGAEIAWWRDGDTLRLLAAEYVKYTLARARMLLWTPQRGTALAASDPAP